jgi:hypothetical protein
VKQLCLLKVTLPSQVNELYEQASDERPSLRAFLKVLDAVSSQFKRTFIVLDAIDEHSSIGGKEMERFLRGLARIRCSLLITSRPGFTQIREVFSKPSTIDIEPKEADIRQYLQSRMRQSSALQHLDEKVRSDMVKKLMERSQEKEERDRKECLHHEEVKEEKREQSELHYK